MKYMLVFVVSPKNTLKLWLLLYCFFFFFFFGLIFFFGVREQ